MVSEAEHNAAMVGVDGWWSGRFVNFTPFQPFDDNVDEFRSLVSSELWEAMADVQVEKIWIIPVCRMLQQLYRIDQTAYTASSSPTLLELTEDFRVAVAITADKFVQNENEVLGREGVPGAGSVTWDQKIPHRARMLLERYKVFGGRVGRS